MVLAMPLSWQSSIIQKNLGKLLNLLWVSEFKFLFDDTFLEYSFISNTNIGHTDRVNCIRWICNDFFLTGSTDNNLCLWNKECEILNKFIGHESSVTSVDGSMQDNVIVSASADSTMRIWTKNKSDEWQCAHVFPCPKSGFVLDLAMVRGGDNIPWIFASFDDCVIRVFTFDSNVLTCCHTLRFVY